MNKRLTSEQFKKKFPAHANALGLGTPAPNETIPTKEAKWAPKYDYSAAFLRFCVSMGLPSPIPEYRFHLVRKWRFDFAWPEYKIALEADGGIFVNGGHNRGAQMLKTWEKENSANVAGWHVLRCQPNELLTAKTAEIIKSAIDSLTKK